MNKFIFIIFFAIVLVSLGCNDKPVEISLETQNKLSQALRDNDPQKLKLLIEKGLNPNFKMWDGTTLLFSAAANGQLECLKILLDSGLNPSEQANDGRTALHYSAQMAFDTSDSARMLLDYGANPSLRDSKGYTSYDYALNAGNSKFAEIVLIK